MCCSVIRSPLCEELLSYFADEAIDLSGLITLEMDMSSVSASPETYINLTELKLNYAMPASSKCYF